MIEKPKHCRIQPPKNQEEFAISVNLLFLKPPY